MALELRWPRSRFWYARFHVNGKKRCLRLGILVGGIPPKSLRLRGDAEFERSRALAWKKFGELEADLRSEAAEERLIQKLHEIRSGEIRREIPLTAIFERWKALPRRKPLSEGYLRNAAATFERFATFARKVSPQTHNMSAISPALAQDFSQTEFDRGLTSKTHSDVVILLRSAFEALADVASVRQNPFTRVKIQRGEPISRVPFTTVELDRLLLACEDDDLMRQLTLACLGTAMRRSDACQIPWQTINLSSRIIKIKTSKTNVTVEIPIFAALQREIDREVARQPNRRPDDYVFPSLAKCSQINPDSLSQGFKLLLGKIGFTNQTSDEGNPTATRVRRERGLRAASIRDIHSLRATWVTLALTAGVPMAVVQLVTGHQLATTVWKHYFRPSAASYRHCLESRLPIQITGADVTQPNPDSDVVATLRAMTSENWEFLRERLIDSLLRPPAYGSLELQQTKTYAPR